MSMIGVLAPGTYLNREDRGVLWCFDIRTKETTPEEK